MTKIRRKIRKNMKDKNGRGMSLSLSSITKIFFVICLVAFLATQLITNAMLSPLGHELQSLNFEKNALIEDNRLLEQEIAKDTSITIIKVYSEDQFKIGSRSNYKSVFITDKSIHAQN